MHYAVNHAPKSVNTSSASVGTRVVPELTRPIMLNELFPAQCRKRQFSRPGKQRPAGLESAPWGQGLGIVALCPFYSCRVESEGLGGPGGVPGVVACRRL